eukprot:3714022-Pyramimonas_sp.AAC.1
MITARTNVASASAEQNRKKLDSYVLVRRLEGKGGGGADGPQGTNSAACQTLREASPRGGALPA